MVNNGYDRRMAIDAVASGRANLMSFGRLFIANPDLVVRFRQNYGLSAVDDGFVGSPMFASASGC